MQRSERGRGGDGGSGRGAGRVRGGQEASVGSAPAGAGAAVAGSGAGVARREAEPGARGVARPGRVGTAVSAVEALKPSDTHVPAGGFDAYVDSHVGASRDDTRGAYERRRAAYCELAHVSPKAFDDELLLLALDLQAARPDAWVGDSWAYLSKVFLKEAMPKRRGGLRVVRPEAA